MRPLVLPLATAAVAACGGGGNSPPDADEALACITSGRGEMYSVGLDHPGKAGLFDVKLMSANPAPPGFNNNTWVIQVNSMAAGVVGSPVDGATILVTPFMPDHQHGTAIKAKIQALPGGQYQLSPINLWMPGYWETTIDVSAGAAHDSVVYKFCIQA
ncbi:MAG TPA: FixH family protein [Kofleriaceae bacterium]